MKQPKILIIGAGFAGAATAYFLHQAGYQNLTLLEVADLPGTKASGLNAAMGRQGIVDPYFRRLAIAGLHFLRNAPADFSPVPLVDQRGSILVFGSDDAAAYQHLAHDMQTDGVAVEMWSREKTLAQLPLLNADHIAGALHTPSDGVIDIHALLSAYLRPLRQQLITNQAVCKIVRTSATWRVHTTNATFDADIIVNAAGAWADTIANLAGAQPMPLTVTRRHLFVSRPTTLVTAHAPFVWDVSHHYYFRPESGGIMISACDEITTAADDAYVRDPTVTTILQEKLQRLCPHLAELPIAHAWAGARSFGPQRQPQIDWDAHVPGFFWVAGLGGHGVTSSAGIGKLAAETIGDPSRSLPLSVAKGSG